MTAIRRPPEHAQRMVGSGGGLEPLVGNRLNRELCRPLDPSDRSPILELDPQGKIIAIHVEGDLHILGVQERMSRIMKASNLAAG
jgi:hypothetical protein